MRFAKAHAYGNDFLYVPLEDTAGVLLDRLVRAMCDRHSGVGADGLVVYERTSNGASMQLFNADGGVAEISGNGVRGLGALLLAGEADEGAALVIQTGGGDKRLVRIAVDGPRQSFRTAMGLPSGLREVRVPIQGESLAGVVVGMGNPHCVFLGPLPEEGRFRHVGPAVERHALFPSGTNVEFVHVESPGRLRILIWERGVGATTSSGTGSCASLVAAAAYGGASRDADVVAPGGAQRVEWREDSVYLTGWAELLCEGHWLGQIPRTS